MNGCIFYADGRKVPVDIRKFPPGNVYRFCEEYYPERTYDVILVENSGSERNEVLDYICDIYGDVVVFRVYKGTDEISFENLRPEWIECGINAMFFEEKIDLGKLFLV